MKNSTARPVGEKPCFAFGTQHKHGEYFTPEHSACTRCVCDNGKETQCIALQCQKPTCKNYEQIPGKCCEYTCPRDFVLTDKSTVAVVVSLSIILMVILVAISMIWRKIRRKEKYHKRLETESTGSSTQQETDMESLLHQNSIPNNLRHSPNKHGHTHDKSSLSTSHLLADHDLPSCSSLPEHKRFHQQNSTNKTNNKIPTKTTITLNQDGTHTKIQHSNQVAIPAKLLESGNMFSNNIQRKMITSNKMNSQSRLNELHHSPENGITVQFSMHTNEEQNNGQVKEYNKNSSQNSSQQLRRFEPPPPYSPPNGRGSFV